MFKRTSYIILTIFFLALGTKTSFSQDPEFTQYYANPLYLNPAFAGSIMCPRLVFNFRDQWPNIPGTFVTYSTSYDQHVNSLFGGIGIMIYNDRAGEGTINTTSASFMYSYRGEVSKNFSIKAALQATYVQKTLDWDKLTWPDMINPKYGFINLTTEKKIDTRVSYPDFSAGLLGYSDMFYGGVAVHHLTQPNETFFKQKSNLPRKYTVHIGTIVPMEGRRRKHRKRLKPEDPVFSPNILYQRQGEFSQFNYGFYCTKYPAVGGVWFRQCPNNADAFIVMVGFIQNSFKFGYSYDLTISSLTTATAGAHEISLSMMFPCSPRRKRARVIMCPSF
ncbi:MAG: type IX secretion system membrane protein PorP/SprF [Bacteroidales bacterium]|nr:type IX secretion system membrane protein PorP/SprF [Bacteroidales bacterium]